MDIKAAKQAIRREVLARTLAMTLDERRRQEQSLQDRFSALPGLDRANVVLLYVSAFAEEFDTRPLLRQTLERGQRLICPKVDWPTHSLRLFELTDVDHSLTPGRRGIPEPVAGCRPCDLAEVDWVLVPGLAFDRRGHRLGRGAGHYDRLLPGLRTEVPRWALILDTQWVETIPIEPHDQPLDGVADAFETVLITGS